MQKKNENKKNKKIVVVAVMALLLALVGISGGETYAKYASSQTNNDKATVAKWGYVVSVDVADLFGESYSNHQNNLCTPKLDDTGVNVNAKADDANVVAPGTTGSMTMSVNGDAEVLSMINTELTIADIHLEANDGNEDLVYYPIVWTLEVDASIDSTNFEFSAGVTKATYNGEFANTNLQADLAKIDEFFEHVEPNKAVEYTLTLSWEWKFENNYNGGASDKVDTILSGLYYNNQKTPSENTFVYQEGLSNETWTDVDSQYTTQVSGTVSVSQIQDA